MVSLTATPQRCAVCGGPTSPREIIPGDRSNYCERCRVFTADSDGRESMRRKRIRQILLEIAVDVAVRRRERQSIAGTGA